MSALGKRSPGDPSWTPAPCSGSPIFSKVCALPAERAACLKDDLGVKHSAGTCSPYRLVDKGPQMKFRFPLVFCKNQPQSDQTPKLFISVPQLTALPDSVCQQPARGKQCSQNCLYLARSSKAPGWSSKAFGSGVGR